MTLRTLRSLGWAPTIGLSWLWGLGFFYSIHVTLTYGWLGFLAFAGPNAAGLYLFGHVLGAPHRNPAEIVRRVEGRFTGLFLLAQVAAVGVTAYGLVAYVLLPLFGPNAPLAAILVLLVGAATGHAASVRALRWLHAGYLAVGVAAALVALAGLAAGPPAPPVPLAAFDERFYGLVLPSLVGFLLGPWSDVQQWQRVVAIHRDGGSIRVAYAGGALLFLGLLVLNASLAALSGPGVLIPSADGIPGAQAAVTGAVARAGIAPVIGAYLLWTLLAMVSTIDSFYAATRWLLTSVTTRSVSPILAFVPAGLVASPLWTLAAALAAAGAVWFAGLSMMYLMLPFATLFVGASLCLVCETVSGRQGYDGVLCGMIGLAAALVFLAGYIAPEGALLGISPIVGAIGALPALGALVGRASPQPPAEAAGGPQPRAVPTLVVPPEEAVASHGFDGPWFVLQLIPTYDDTNSVGNIYFANYFRWVGKARELFFNVCMPDFDLATTGFYVLTRSFTHDFRREAREFEPIFVRIRIASHNRKFVTLSHEIHSRTQGLLGRGEQTLMFVDTVRYRPLDIPASIMAGFMPHFVRDEAAPPLRARSAAALMPEDG
ncbi:acyl-CoA thioesterase [Methylobacterium planeticum]|uniref:Acyl-CoA thioesterase n=1 Tax=Methylobacterium planeticum TaxID=2615211 RepID=A0A6N6MFL7_9HYPH|nr:thioesterase family protein [Methylobacterium planeticum]KAB1069613.1 acyl-CoA thioesterase [Methylobacterium planeticum]